MSIAATKGFDPYAVIDFSDLGEEQRDVRYGFEIGCCRLAVERSVLTEVVRAPVLYPIPNAPSLLRGMLNLRGKLIPVFDLHGWLGAGAPARDAYLLIIDEHDNAAGAYIDGLPTALDYGTSETVDGAAADVPEVLKSHCIDTSEYQGHRWHTVDHVSMFEKLSDRTGT